MAYHIQIPEGRLFVELVYTGNVSPAELAASIADTVAAVQKTGFKLVLTDCTALTGGHDAFHLFDGVLKLLEKYPAMDFKEAIILNPDADVTANRNVRFWEAACMNRGLHVRVFNDRTEAQTWLLA